jgi:flavin-dependent dehydrogenase
VRDVIVVGARCAGSPVGMLLARKGYDVLLVDRATFPSEIPHGHFIHHHGPRLLHKWGLLDRILASGCPPIETMTFDLGDFPLTGRDLHAHGVPMGLAPRRAVLDKILVDAAAEAGADVWEGFTVERYDGEDGAIVGVTGKRRGSSPTSERARITIGADGRNSLLAKSVGAAVEQATDPLTCWYFSYWAGVIAEGTEVYVRQNHVIFVFPTNDNLVGIFIAWSRDQFPKVRSDIEGHFMAAIDGVPDLARRIRAGARAERFLGFTDVPNFIRQSHGPGWALVGDAFRDAELLADAVDAGLSGRMRLDDALAEYQRARNEAGRESYLGGIEAARFSPRNPEELHLRAALRGNQADTNEFFKAFEGMSPREAFFNPPNIGRIIATAAINGSIATPPADAPAA